MTLTKGLSNFETRVVNSTNDSGASLAITVDWGANTITENATTKSIRDISAIYIDQISIALPVGTLLKCDVVVTRDPAGTPVEVYRLAGHENALPGGIIALPHPLELSRGAGATTDNYRVAFTFSGNTGAVARHVHLFGFFR